MNSYKGKRTWRRSFPVRWNVAQITITVWLKHLFTRKCILLSQNFLSRTREFKQDIDVVLRLINVTNALKVNISIWSITDDTIQQRRHFALWQSAPYRTANASKNRWNVLGSSWRPTLQFTPIAVWLITLCTDHWKRLRKR